MQLRRAVVLVLTLAIAVGLRLPVQAQTPGVTATEIKLGNTNPYSGPASAYGTIGKPHGAYFKKINEEGGVNGRKINLICLTTATARPRRWRGTPAGRAGPGGPVPDLGTPTNTRHPQVRQPRRCRTCSWPPAPPSGATPRTSRGPSAST